MGSLIMAIEDLEQAIRNARLMEHVHNNVELKSNWAQKHGEKLCALANKFNLACAWLVVGISDDGLLLNRDENWAKETEKNISHHINENLDPSQGCQGVSCVEVLGSWLVVIAVKNPGEVVYWGGTAFKAAGTTQLAMMPDEILQLRIQLPGLTDFTRQNAASDYDAAQSGSFARKIREMGYSFEYSDANPNDYLECFKKLGINRKQAARILFGDCTYRIARFDKNHEPIENKSFRGLYRFLDDSLIADIQRWTSKELGATGDPYPPRTLKEGLANCVAHAAYFERDGDIIVELHPEYICISNLCIKESAFFANKWFSRSHKTVNGLLMEVLRIAGCVDELGRGKNLIFSESIRQGKRPPEVHLERAGRYDRWKLFIYGGMQDKTYLRLLDRSKELYRDDQKALIAQALVLWRDKPVSEIRNYVDGDFSRQFAEVLSGLEGPIYYYAKGDKITLMRWATVLLGEGKDSKALSPAEEERLRKFAYEHRTKYFDGYITPKELRSLADMSNTRSEMTLSSTILRRWEKQGYVKKVGNGKYKFITMLSLSKEFLNLLEQFTKKSEPSGT